MATYYRRKEKGRARRIWGIILTVYGAMLLFSSLILSGRLKGETKGATLALIVLAVIFLLIGILLLRSAAQKDPYGKWKTKDPSKETGLIRKVHGIKDDSKLLEIGKQAGLDSVAQEAFGRISNQSALGYYVSQNYGSSQRLRAALSFITDSKVLADVVRSSHSLSADLRKQAVLQMTDADCLKQLAQSTEKTISQDVRTAIYDRLREVIQEQGGDVCDVDRILAGDKAMPVGVRQQAYADLESAGRDGDRLLAEDESMHLNLRMEAYERIGDHENAEKIRRRIDQTALLHSGNSSEYRAAAAKRILATGDEEWIETNVKKVLEQGEKTEKAVKDFFVETSKQYPDIIKKMWPQISSFAHSDATRHEDGHSDSIHEDSYGNGRNGYRLGQHIDYRNYSDCTHSDSRNENIHTDNTDERFLQEFPPAIQDPDA